ncbi:MAG: hypothetical protein ABEJ96_09645, partial [Thiohalorhabdaceae bacterium]
MQPITRPLVTAVLTAGLAVPAHAQEGDSEKRLEELERKIEVLAKEVKEQPQASGQPAHARESHGGVGHAAAAVYDQPKGVSVAGYGNVFYQASSAGDELAMPLRQVLYVGYRYNDWLVFNSEVEFETEVEAEGNEVEERE